MYEAILVIPVILLVGQWPPGISLLAALLNLLGNWQMELIAKFHEDSYEHAPHSTPSKVHSYVSLRIEISPIRKYARLYFSVDPPRPC